MRIKRVEDLVLGTAVLIVLAPVMAVVAGLIAVTMGRPILFRQVRPGLGGRPFTLTKFRTMSDDRDDRGNLLPDESRITRLGAFLRRSSLDELPELLAVLKGEMSLVGPRPLRVAYLDRYTTFQARRHEIRPGITGLAQANGRNTLDWGNRLAMDVWYVDNWSLGLDLKILAKTVWGVLSMRGVSADGHATMPEFMGDA